MLTSFFVILFPAIFCALQVTAVLVTQPNSTSVWYSGSENNQIQWLKTANDTVASDTMLSIQLQDMAGDSTLFLKSRVPFGDQKTTVPLPEDTPSGQYLVALVDFNDNVIASSPYFLVVQNTTTTLEPTPVMQPSCAVQIVCHVEPVISYTTMCVAVNPPM